MLFQTAGKLVLDFVGFLKPVKEPVIFWVALFPDLGADKCSKLTLCGAGKSLVWNQSESVKVILCAKSVALESFLMLHQAYGCPTKHLGYILSLRQLILTFCFIWHFAFVLVFLISFDYTLFTFRLVRVIFGWHLRLKLQNIEVLLALLVISIAEIQVAISEFVFLFKEEWHLCLYPVLALMLKGGIFVN